MPIERSDNEIFLHLREQTLAIETDEIGLGYFLKLLDHSSFDLAILSLAIPLMIPMPPGIPTIAGVLFMVLGFQGVMGKTHLWIPEFIARKSIHKTSTLQAVDKASRWFGWVSRRQTNVWPVFIQSPVREIAYAMIVLQGFIMILPIPFVGNTLPALVFVLLSLGRLNKNGSIVFLGLLISLLVIGINGFLVFESWNLFENFFNR